MKGENGKRTMILYNGEKLEGKSLEEIISKVLDDVVSEINNDKTESKCENEKEPFEKKAEPAKNRCSFISFEEFLKELQKEKSLKEENEKIHENVEEAFKKADDFSENVLFKQWFSEWSKNPSNKEGNMYMDYSRYLKKYFCTVERTRAYSFLKTAKCLLKESLRLNKATDFAELRLEVIHDLLVKF